MKKGNHSLINRSRETDGDKLCHYFFPEGKLRRRGNMTNALAVNAKFRRQQPEV